MTCRFVLEGCFFWEVLQEVYTSANVGVQSMGSTSPGTFSDSLS